MISRERLVVQSVQDFVKAGLDARGLTGRYDFSDSFPWTMEEPPDRPLVCAGFNFDDDGEPAEMGSDLTTRQYGIEFFVFGLDGAQTSELAHHIKFALERDGTVPLFDYGQDPPALIDHLILEGSSAARQAYADPEPWQENTWSTVGRVRDTYYASAA